MAPFRPDSIRPTAARSRVGTSVIAASGRSGFAQALHQAFMDRAAGAETVGAAAQDHGIAGLQAQHAGIRRDIGPALEDHADDAERHAHALDGHAVRPLPALGDDADGIGDAAHDVDAFGHGLDARRRQRQAIDEGGGGAAGARASATSSALAARIAARIGADRPLHGLQRPVLLLRRRQRQHARGSAGTGGEIGHQRLEIGIAVDGFEGGGHGSSTFC